jgi:23S rRNA (uracil1939-C5)-methyltransferase
MGEVFELELHADSFGGDCLARLPDGRTVFVPFGIVGEKVQVELTEEKRNYARGRIVKLLSPSPKRILPRCAHFQQCGGCHYQQLNYADQLEMKQKIVADQLERIGKILNPPVHPIIGSEKEWNYRNTVQFHLSRAGKPGYQGVGGRGVVEITECHLPLEPINALWAQIEIDPASGIERVSIRCDCDEELLVGFESTKSQAPEFEVDFPISVVFMGAEGNVLLSGEDYSLMRVKSRDFRVSAGSFFQVNLSMAEKMVEYVLTFIGKEQISLIVDAYCGVGLFSAFLAPLSKELIGIELSESSSNDYSINLDEFDNVSLYMGAVEEVLPALKIKPDILLLDPPRSGLDPKALTGVIESKPGKIIYISCDPATLARDLKYMITSGYNLESVTPFDLFPQTYHIESISILTKKEEE